MSLPKGFSPTIVLAFAIIYVVWGTTYFANLVAIETIPTFLLIVTRLSVAGAILLLAAVVRAKLTDKEASKWVWPTPREWRNLGATSVLFLTVGMGAVVWAEHYIESGTTALLVAIEPLVVVLVLWAFDRQRPQWQSFAGIALGIVGTALLVGQDIVISGEGAWWGVAAIMLGVTAWAFGSVLTARLALPQNRLQTSGWQLLIAGTLAWPLSFAFDDLAGFRVSDVSERSLYAYVYLVVFGSIVAYSAFLYLLQRVSPEKVATSTYVHPVVALSIGVWLGAEQVSGQTIVACVVMLTGVLFVNVKWSRRADRTPTLPRQAHTGMVQRRWRGRALPGREDDLAEFLDAVVVPHMRSAEGNLHVHIERGGDAGFAVESHWRDREAEAQFVDGDDVGRPRYYKGEDLLIDGDSQEIQHG